MRASPFDRVTEASALGTALDGADAFLCHDRGNWWPGGDRPSAGRAFLRWGEVFMVRQNINRISAIALLVMSLLAFTLVLVAVAAGWNADMTDEGSAAHIFIFLSLCRLPLIGAFLITADRKRFSLVATILSLQVAAITLVFGPVAFFKL